MNNSEYLNEFLKYVSTDSILVVTAKGELIRLYCPFKVKALVAFPELPLGGTAQVTKIQLTPDAKDVFIIEGKAYYATFFQLVKQGIVNSTDSNVEYQRKDYPIYPLRPTQIQCIPYWQGHWVYGHKECVKSFT